MVKEKDSRGGQKSPAHALPASDGGGMNTGVAIIGFILCFMAGGGLMWGWDQHRIKSGDITADTSSATGPNWADNDSPIPVDSKDPMWGNRNAPVTIVQFSDFQCPYCSKVEATMEQVKTTYGADKVRVIWKNEPLSFHPNAKPAAEAAQAVFALKGNDAFWKFHSTAFKNQQSLNSENYEKWAAAAGADPAKFKAGIAAHKWADKVEKDHAIAKQIGVNGTPAFFVNGVSLSGAQPFEKFKAVIDAELQRANAKIASGTPKDKVYVVMSSENKKNAPPAAEEEEGEKEDTKTVWKVPVGKSAQKGGGDKALVTIMEFSDFQCPFCKKVGDTMKKIHETYGDKVRVVWKNEPLPFHPRAEPAAELALEARAQKGDKGFWEAHDKLFDVQPKLDDADLEKVATEMGLNLDKVKSAIKDHKYKKEIDGDQDVADDYQASGTPHFFVNGRRLVGAQPFDKFQKIIDEEIKESQDLLAKGVKPDEIYEAQIKDGKGTPEPEKKTIPTPANLPTKGNATAKVTIVEISDFQCPYCKKVEDSMAEVMKNYGDKVKVQWMNLPLPMHADAPLAAQATREAFKQKGSDGFWKFHDLLFANQATEGGLKRESLEKYAKQLGLDDAKFKAALDSQSHKAEVEADAKIANDAGISGTPAFLINGYYINGAQPYPKFRKLIERALSEAK
jgi:protein-disulfide isomerase